MTGLIPSSSSHAFMEAGEGHGQEGALCLTRLTALKRRQRGGAAKQPGRSRSRLWFCLTLPHHDSTGLTITRLVAGARGVHASAYAILRAG